MKEILETNTENDLEKAKTWYAKIFEREVLEFDEVGQRWSVLNVDPTKSEVYANQHLAVKRPLENTEPLVIGPLYVEDVRSCLEKVLNADIKGQLVEDRANINEGITLSEKIEHTIISTTPLGEMCFFYDPYGNLCQLVQPELFTD